MTLRPYVSDIISTLSRRRAERVSDLLQEAHVGKEEINQIITRLENTNDFAPTSLTDHSDHGRILRRTFQNNISNIRGDTAELYRIINLVSLLLDSQSEQLSSRVEQAEREIDSMEKLLDLYSFMLADNQRYDSSYMETFHDERGRSAMDIVPDRAGQPFSMSLFGNVRVDEGVFCIPDKAPSGYALAASVIGSNAADFSQSETDINSMLFDGSNKGWKFTVSAPHRIHAPMEQDPWRHSGAQVLLEFVLPDPVPATEITLTPNTNTPTEEVLSIRLYETMDYDDGWRQILDEPHNLKRVKSFHFPPQPVARFQVLLNQPVHRHSARDDNYFEDRYRRMISRMSASRNTGVGTAGNPSLYDGLLQAVSQDSFGKAGESDFDHTVLDVLYHTDPHIWRESFEGVEDITDLPVDSEDDALPAPRPLDSAIDRWARPLPMYYYSLGLKSVTASIETLSNKAAFVTNAIPASGDMGVVRLKADYNNQFAVGSDRDSTQISSVEFSVSNLSEPELEENWIPIMPVGESRILGERLFLDKDGVGKLRFPADPNEVLKVYRQGYEVDDRIVHFRYDGPWVSGLELDVGTISQEDVFTCDYYPGKDHTTIDFRGRGFDSPPLAFAHSDNGPGEWFAATRDRNRVKLANQPYTEVDVDGEEPIIVQLENGQVASNKTGDTLDPGEDLSFVQSGRDVIFNKPISEPFRVFYHYLENNVRVRAVLRGNGRDFVTPELRSFKLKGRLRRPVPNSG